MPEPHEQAPQAPNQDAPGPEVLPPHKDELWLKKRRRHEAAHAVVGHELGGRVAEVVAGGPRDLFGIKIKWPAHDKAIAEVDWLVAASADKAREAGRQKVVCFVAGHLAEKDVDPTTELVSHRITDELLISNLAGDSDRDQVIAILNSINCANIAEVTAAETRAGDILKTRAERLSAVETELEKAWLLKDKPLADALSQ